MIENIAWVLGSWVFVSLLTGAIYAICCWRESEPMLSKHSGGSPVVYYTVPADWSRYNKITTEGTGSGPDKQP